jgi:hypothetical protein
VSVGVVNGVSTTTGAGTIVSTVTVSVVSVFSEELLQATANDAIATIARNFFIVGFFEICEIFQGLIPGLLKGNPGRPGFF